MRRNFLHDQTILIQNLRARGIQGDGQIANRKRFARAKCLLIRKGAVLSHQQIYKSRGPGEESCAVRAKHTVGDWFVTGKRSRVEESGQVSAVIDMQMGQQNRIYFFEVQFQFSDAQERTRSGIHQNPRSSCDQHDVT